MRQRIWTRNYWETNPASDKVEALNLGTPNYNTSALNHSATLPADHEQNNITRTHFFNLFGTRSILLGFIEFLTSCIVSLLWLQTKKQNSQLYFTGHTWLGMEACTMSEYTFKYWSVVQTQWIKRLVLRQQILKSHKNTNNML